MASARVEYRDEAIVEVADAVSWYQDQSPPLAERFAAALKDTERRVAEAPDRWPAGRRGTRRCLMRGFPYAVVYRQTLGGVEVVAVMHGSRRPDYWMDRLE